jgi:hypothetical protein
MEKALRGSGVLTSKWNRGPTIRFDSVFAARGAFDAFGRRYIGEVISWKCWNESSRRGPIFTPVKLR